MYLHEYNNIMYNQLSDYKIHYSNTNNTKYFSFQVQTLFSFPLLRIEKCYYETNYLLGIAFAFDF